MTDTSSRGRWLGPDSEIGRFVDRESEKRLEAYRAQPTDVTEHARHEAVTARGGYAQRQIVELVQNGADQLQGIEGGGRIEIRISRAHLYCADAGAAIDTRGVQSLFHSYLSPKQGADVIGRFGLGFKSILAVADGADFFSRNGSFRFDRTLAEERIRTILPDVTDFPALRIAEPVDPAEAATLDPLLEAMMAWATNIVRLPLKDGAYGELIRQMEEFPAEFLLFVPHVGDLLLGSQDGSVEREIRLKQRKRSGVLHLLDDGDDSRWRVFRRTHALSDDAKNDARLVDHRETVELKWAAPSPSGSDWRHFWSFFPTLTTSLIPGILNAPWKTNEDRQNLLDGPYNDEVIAAAADLATVKMREFSNPSDPARHLDYLPRRHESGDNDHAEQLRRQLYELLGQRASVPDQNGQLRRHTAVQYPPDAIISGRQIVAADALARWAAYEHRPSAWLHPSAVTRDRLSTIDRIFSGDDSYRKGAPRTSLAKWLEALVLAGRKHEDPVGASRAAVTAAVALPKAIREREPLGKIVLRADDGWAAPDADSISLSTGSDDDPQATVHPDLAADPEARKALMVLGVGETSTDSRVRRFASALSRVDGEAARSDPRWRLLWQALRKLQPAKSREVLGEYFDGVFNQNPVRALSRARTWEPLRELLLPGLIVPGDGSRDAVIALDVGFHESDRPLLEALGVAESPFVDRELPGPLDPDYLWECRSRFQKIGADRVGARPSWNKLNFTERTTPLSLDVFKHLSAEGAARYTEALLNLDDTFRPWTMRHDSADRYGKEEFPSPVVWMLRKYGRIVVGDRFPALASGLGEEPDKGVQRWLLSHRKTNRIREAFPDLKSDFPDADPVGEEEALPLLDVWPGLTDYLSSDDEDTVLVRCQRIVDAEGKDLPNDCVRKGHQLFLTEQDEERAELAAVVRELKLELYETVFDRVLGRETPRDVSRAREKVSRCGTDAERLLEAVGEERLRRRLPETLAAILDTRRERFAGVRVAEAAIATFHTGALKKYRHDISHLRPPKQWAGGRAVLAFVKELGFDPEWAGQPSPKREAFLEVPGPRSLPDLHSYQREIVNRTKAMLRGAADENRGLISMPTGSGKTRVAVEAIIETIRDKNLSGAVLWVADRDELCEQAVEAWREAWASIGPEAEQLRISRWWRGQPEPEAMDESHVVVSTIQTLRSRIARDAARAALAKVRLLVVDEAHGSIAPSFTSLMSQLGLTARRHDKEPLLLGLTATPYRGRDENETRRLVLRYGKHRLDAGAFESDEPKEVVHELQEMTVLAEVDHAVTSGANLRLAPDEVSEIREKRLPWLPDRVERRIAEDSARTERIIAAYRKKVAREIGEDAPTLIFATSVDHAKTVAAMLQLEGVAARAVSGETDAAVRRSVVEQFRDGKLAVLVNYGIFREGFDAPKTRAIIVARPVFSPNLYFQMIGRGLRGVKNGGSDRCLILDVEDNIENYDGALAFSELDWLWTPEDHPSSRAGDSG